MKSRHPLDATFGPLEIRVLEALWARSAAAAVRDLQPDFPGVAYTTLMTTLDRLFRKGTLARDKRGRAFFYQPKATRDQLISQLAGSAFANLMPGAHEEMRPILSMFVDTVGARDQALLDELESLVRARRDELKANGAERREVKGPK
jgi:predicted transcriptional regulator